MILWFRYHLLPGNTLLSPHAALCELLPSIPEGQSYRNRCPNRFFHKEAWESGIIISGDQARLDMPSHSKGMTLYQVTEYLQSSISCIHLVARRVTPYSTWLYSVTFHYASHTNHRSPLPHPHASFFLSLKRRGNGRMKKDKSPSGRGKLFLKIKILNLHLAREYSEFMA